MIHNNQNSRYYICCFILYHKFIIPQILHGAHMSRQIPLKAKPSSLLLHSLAALATLLTYACQWDDGMHQRYVGDRGYVEPCKGVCISANLPKTKETCRPSGHEQAGYQWTDPKCLINDRYTDITDETACTAQDGTWLPGECKIIEQSACEDAPIHGKWAAFQLYDMDNGFYLRKWNDSYICGTYQEIESGTAKKCNHIEPYLEDMKYGLCHATASCRNITLNDTDVAACTSCPKENIKCGNECVDIMRNENNCGECGKACDKATQYCANGRCIAKAECPDKINYLRCSFDPDTNTYKEADEFETDFKCLNTQSDVSHCGWKTCENREEIAPCDEKQTCINGQCEHIKCEGDELLACEIEGGVKCISKTNNETCGATSCDENGLGISCEGELICLNAQGECGCLDGLVKHGLSCLDPNSPRSCGVTHDSPGTECTADQTCIGGKCICNSRLVKCGDTCVSPKDNAYCGADANCQNYTPCQADETCSNGVCICSNDLPQCDGKCTERDNLLHCGATGFCNDENIDSSNFTGYRCNLTGKHACKRVDNDFICECHDGERFDKRDGKCKSYGADAEFCGPEGINCKLTYGDQTLCVNGECQCPAEWLKIDASLKDAWGDDWDLDDKYMRCIDTRFDKRFCGATSASRTDADNGIRKCNPDEMCFFGKCIPADIQKCEIETGGRLCKNNQCMMLKDHHMRQCSACEAGYCSLAGEPSTEGCHGIHGKNCNCPDDQILVYEHEAKHAVCKPIDNLHIETGSGTISKFVCQDGWANANTMYQEYDQSFDITDSDGCETHIYSDTSNCGNIGNACPAQNDLHQMTPLCVNGSCTYEACYYDGEHNYHDCNGDFGTDGDGCEVDLYHDIKHCGSCNNVCTKNRICDRGTCCYGEHIITDWIKSHPCCDGLVKYRQCVAWFLGCWDMHYQCAPENANLEGWETF